MMLPSRTARGAARSAEPRLATHGGQARRARAGARRWALEAEQRARRRLGGTSRKALHGAALCLGGARAALQATPLGAFMC